MVLYSTENTFLPRIASMYSVSTVSAMQSIRANADGLSRTVCDDTTGAQKRIISGERIWMETRQILKVGRVSVRAYLANSCMHACYMHRYPPAGEQRVCGGGDGGMQCIAPYWPSMDPVLPPPRSRDARPRPKVRTSQKMNLSKDTCVVTCIHRHTTHEITLLCALMENVAMWETIAKEWHLSTAGAPVLVHVSTY